MDQEPVLSWLLFGSCGELRCEAHPYGGGYGYQVALLNEGTMLSVEWVPDLPALLRRSAEMRERLKDCGFDFQPPRTPMLLGGPSWGPPRPSTTLLECLR